MIRILACGKVKEKAAMLLLEEYLSRLNRYTTVEYLELKSLEAKHLKGYVIALDEKGAEYSSTNFAKKLEKLTASHKTITFVVGPAQGLPLEIRKNANELLSLSQMTFPNQLVRVFLVEQLYRAWTIRKNENYHKE